MAGAKKSVKKPRGSSSRSTKVKVVQPPAGDPALFAPLTEGERADTLRLLLEDNRLANMAKVGRYRVIAIEPLALKGEEPHRVARVVIYDYSADRCVEANVDLDAYSVEHLNINRSQPMLSAEEESIAMAIAVGDADVQELLSLGQEAQAAMHYWSHRTAELSHSRRTAAVLLGNPDDRPTHIAIVDLLDSRVTEIVAADQW